MNIEENIVDCYSEIINVKSELWLIKVNNNKNEK